MVGPPSCVKAGWRFLFLELNFIRGFDEAQWLDIYDILMDNDSGHGNILFQQDI